MSADFLDTSVFVYLFDETAPAKRGIAEDIVRRAIEEGTGAISYQVAQEALNVLTRKLNATPAPPPSASSTTSFRPCGASERVPSSSSAPWRSARATPSAGTTQ
jgi:predicted nucleic acid-binding protein